MDKGLANGRTDGVKRQAATADHADTSATQPTVQAKSPSNSHSLPDTRGQAVIAQLAPHATRLRLRAHQTLNMAAPTADTLMVVETGCLVHLTAIPNAGRVVMALLYPGDVVVPAPPMPAASLEIMAGTDSDLLRLNWSSVHAATAAMPDRIRIVLEAMGNQNTRASMHGALLASLTASERVASLLLELALRLGQSRGGDTRFVTPLTRAEMAQYLALNADTLSRIMSRLRAADIVAQPERGVMIVRDMPALAAMTPVAAALRDLHGAASTLTPAVALPQPHA